MSFIRKKKALKKVAVFSTIAAAVGFAAGILTAPKSGRETRHDLKEAADKGLAGAEKELKKLNKELGSLIDEAKLKGGQAGSKAQKELKQLVEKAEDTKEKAREVISAIHEGEANDKDLAKAVKQSKAALKNLRNYLKK